MFGIRSVLKADGSVHQEQQLGSLRTDLTTGETSRVIGAPGALQRVVGPDGQTHLEQQFGSMRLSYGQGGIDRIL